MGRRNTSIKAFTQLQKSIKKQVEIISNKPIKRLAKKEHKELYKFVENYYKEKMYEDLEFELIAIHEQISDLIGFGKSWDKLNSVELTELKECFNHESKNLNLYYGLLSAIDYENGVNLLKKEVPLKYGKSFQELTYKLSYPLDYFKKNYEGCLKHLGTINSTTYGYDKLEVHFNLKAYAKGYSDKISPKEQEIAVLLASLNLSIEDQQLIDQKIGLGTEQTGVRSI